MTAYLKTKGHRIIDLRKVKNWNNLEIFVNGESIFNCKLNELEFGGDGELDPIVIEAEKRISNAF